MDTLLLAYGLDFGLMAVSVLAVRQLVLTCS